MNKAASATAFAQFRVFGHRPNPLRGTANSIRESGIGFAKDKTYNRIPQYCTYHGSLKPAQHPGKECNGIKAQMPV